MTDRYTLYTLIVRVLHALHWKVGHKNKRKQIWTLQYIALRISDLQKQNHRFWQRLKLCSCIVFISDYQRVRCSASESRFCVGKWFIAKKSMLSAKIWYSFWGLITPTFGYQCNPEENFVHFEASSSYVIFKNFIENCWCLSILTWVRRNISAWKFGD